MNNNDEIDMGYILGIISILLGMINVQENRLQSAQNDVQAANDKQAKYLLEELTKKFEEQNEILKKQSDTLNNIAFMLSINAASNIANNEQNYRLKKTGEIYKGQIYYNGECCTDGHGNGVEFY